MNASFLSTGVVVFFACSAALAQGKMDPLTIHGLDKTTLHSPAARSMGGVTVGIRNDVGLMFQNPATLHSLERMQVSIGALQQFKTVEQVQEYAPVKYYSNLSLLLEGLTASIPDPDSSLGGATARDTVQRPYDSIGPNWSTTRNRTRPLQAFLGVPFAVGGLRLVAGVGVVEYANLNYHYQHNNVLSPGILSQRPLPTPRPPNDANPIHVQWHQRIASRDGFVRGYGFALSGSIPEWNLAVGVSGMLLRGSSDDFEQTVMRGRMTFFTNAFRLDSAYGRMTKSGTSEFSGSELTVAAEYRTRSVVFGFIIKPPARIGREYSATIVEDTTGVPVTRVEGGKDRVRLPWRGSVGLSIMPKDDLTLGLHYEYRPYGSAGYKVGGGVEEYPWLSSSVFGIGLEYRPLEWLQLRGGMRGAAEVFEPEGNPLPGEPVTYSVYSGGLGITYGSVRLHIAYEYSLMKYQDVWGSGLSRNRAAHQSVVAGLTVDLPWKTD